MTFLKKFRAENSCYFSALLSENRIKPFRTVTFLFWDAAWCKLLVATYHNFISKFVLSRKLFLSHGGKTRLRVFENWVFKTVFRLRREKVTTN